MTKDHFRIANVWDHRATRNPGNFQRFPGVYLSLLSVGSLIGVRLALPLAGRMTDRLHAGVYILLLVIVGLALAFK